MAKKEQIGSSYIKNLKNPARNMTGKLETQNDSV